MMTYEYDKDNSIIHLKASGILVVSDPINYFKDLDNNPDFESKAEEHVYFTDLEDIAFTFTDVMEIRSAFKKYGHGDKVSHVTFFVDSELSYGMARMVTTMLDDVFESYEIVRK